MVAKALAMACQPEIRAGSGHVCQASVLRTPRRIRLSVRSTCENQLPLRRAYNFRAIVSCSELRRSRGRLGGVCYATLNGLTEDVMTRAFPLLDPSKSYTWVSPGVCDECISNPEGFHLALTSISLVAANYSSYVTVLPALSRLECCLAVWIPSHRTNIQRCAECVEKSRLVYGVDPHLMAKYWTWEMAYVEFLESIRADSPKTKATDCTLLHMVEQKERLLRAHNIDDPFKVRPFSLVGTHLSTEVVEES
eukprot:6473223-Pyramimonas_sp.AAC.1